MTFHLMNPAAGQSYPAYSGGKEETLFAKTTQPLTNRETGEVVGEFAPFEGVPATVFRGYRTAYMYPVFVHITEDEMYCGMIDSRNFWFNEIPKPPKPPVTQAEAVEQFEASKDEEFEVFEANEFFEEEEEEDPADVAFGFVEEPEPKPKKTSKRK